MYGYAFSACYVKFVQSDAWTGSEIDKENLFVADLVESAFHGFVITRRRYDSFL